MRKVILSPFGVYMDLFFYGESFFKYFIKMVKYTQYSPNMMKNRKNIQKHFKNHYWYTISNKMPLLIFNNKIIDLAGFFLSGEQYILEKVKGREVSRFLSGVCNLEDGTALQYPHSKNAITLLKNHVFVHINSN
ncbi:unnamed protein product [Paramecium sonneborni]|uniref:Uncharacterized protein n=1 Tax=Paramecium sonneborni TaxID=65129 RepID=A0A8S1RBJ0_9CILI|nr:unnamed protein product [Paramecium sonneborni]